MRVHAILLLLLVSSLLLPACGGGGGGGGDTAPEVVPPVLRVVTTLNDAGAGSLRQTIQDALPGEWVVFDTMLPVGTVNLLSPIPIQKEVVVGGLSSTFERFEIRASGGHRIFEMQPGTSLDLRDLIVADGDGTADPGGAINAQGVTLRLSRVLFVGCHAPNAGGGAISLMESQLFATDCGFTACTARWGGAVSITETVASFDRCSFYLNTAISTIGGAMHVISCTADVLNSTFDSNQASSPVSGWGGALGIGTINGFSETNVRLTSCTLSANAAGDLAGGIYAGRQDPPCHITISQSIVATNTAPSAADLEFANGATATGENNILGVGDGSGYFFNGIGDNQVGDPVTPVEPLLLLADFHAGGRVMRMPHMLSPALDAIPAGSCVDLEGAALVVDQRGEPRSAASACDIGAIER